MALAEIFISALPTFGINAVPVKEHQFHPERRWRFDMAFVKEKLAIEIEGGVYTRGAHGSVTGILRDIEKYNAATVLGWRILRFPTDKLIKAESFHMIRQALINQHTK